MRYAFDALSGLVKSHFEMNPLSSHIFVFFSRRRDRMKLLFWDCDGFVLYYKRLERGTYSWVLDLDLEAGGEIQASDFALILAGINPRPEALPNKRKISMTPPTTPLRLV